MSRPDLTVIINAHNETVVSGPTIRSAEAAIVLVETAGYDVERLIVLDNPTLKCSSYYESDHFQNWKKSYVSFKDLGLARNEGVKISKGEFVVFLDADDLVSENWFLKGLEELKSRKRNHEKCIAHTHINWTFDAVRNVTIKIGQDDPLFSPIFFFVGNYYDALCMAPREAFEEVPYAARDKEKGYGYEDWRFNIEAMKRGWRHIIIKNTVTFIRRRDNSLLLDLASNKSLLWPLEELKIEYLSKLCGWR